MILIKAHFEPYSNFDTKQANIWNKKFQVFYQYKLRSKKIRENFFAVLMNKFISNTALQKLNGFKRLKLNSDNEKNVSMRP